MAGRGSKQGGDASDGPERDVRPSRRLIRTITKRLEKAYGPRDWEPDGDPLGGLIETILSQNTNDANSSAAYEELRRRLPTWEQVRDARTDKIERAIRRGGLAKQKAGRIKKILQHITERHGKLSLDWLDDMPPDEAVETLCGLKGIGRKTAACVMMFNLGKPVLPVDTHVHRVSLRLGLMAEGTSADQAHDDLQAICPDELVWPFHVLLITHGRQRCRSQRPACKGCPLLDICPTGQANV